MPLLLKPRHLILPLGTAVGAALLCSGCWSAFGRTPEGENLARIKTSPHYEDGAFVNPIETNNTFKWPEIKTLGTRIASRLDRSPPGPIPVAPVPQGTFEQPWNGQGVRFVWVGHATMLLEFDGFRILTDPIWSKRCSPVSFAGPARFHPPGIPLDRLPPVDAVVISHDHYDHLDEATIKALAARGTAFYVPLGVGSHLRRWGVTHVYETDWGQEHTISKQGKTLQLVATPARHFSGRGPFQRNDTLWASWALVGPTQRVWFGGDTGYFEGLKEIGQKFGPFDLTLMPIGAYDTLWQAVHLNPEEAIQAHHDVRGKAMVPIHWGTFNLAFHSWKEPIAQAQALARAKGVTLHVPKPGEVVHTAQAPSGVTWWQTLEKAY